MKLFCKTLVATFVISLLFITFNSKVSATNKTPQPLLEQLQDGGKNEKQISQKKKAEGIKSRCLVGDVFLPSRQYCGAKTCKRCVKAKKVKTKK